MNSIYINQSLRCLGFRRLYLYVFILCLLGLCGHASAQNAISFKIGKTAEMSPTDLAGAEVRVDHWNNLLDLAVGTSSTHHDVMDKEGKPVQGMTVTIMGGRSTIGAFDWVATPGSNEDALFNGAYDQNDDDPTVITITGIPFAKYDVYFYRCEDNEMSDKRAGSFQIGEVTFYVRGGKGNPKPDGTGYICSSDKSPDPGSITQGNYVKFEGLQGDKLKASFTAISVGDPALRNKVSGFQIVEAK